MALPLPVVVAEVIPEPSFAGLPAAGPGPAAPLLGASAEGGGPGGSETLKTAAAVAVAVAGGAAPGG